MVSSIAWSSFWATVIAALQVICLSGVGYLLARTGRIDRVFLRKISNLLTDIFLPSFILYHTLSGSDNLRVEWVYLIPAVGIGMLVASLLLGFVIAKVLRIREANLFSALVSFQNCGYMPLIMVSVMFGPEKREMFYSWIFLYIIGFNFLVWSFGVWLVSGREGEGLWKKVINPPFLSTIVAVVLALLGLANSIPAGIYSFLEILSRPVLPLSMLVMGGILGLNCMSCSLNHRLLALTVITKLVVLPMIALMILSLLKFSILTPDLRWFILLESAVPSAVSLAVISESYGGDTPFISQVLFYTHLVSVVTIPVFLLLLKGQ